MGKNRKEKSKQINMPRISPMDDVKYFQEIVSWALAMHHINYIKENGIESEWDNDVTNLFNQFYSVQQSVIEGYSSLLLLKEKGLDISTINLDDFREKIKEINRTQDPTFNQDSIHFKYRKLTMSRFTLGNHILMDSSLPKREREIITLRSAWLSGSEYIWDHHIDIEKNIGLSIEDLNCIKKNLNAIEKNTFDFTLISAVDELYTNAILSDETWNSLSQQYNTFQIMDLVFIIGFYIQLGIALNTLKIQTEKMVKDYDKNNSLPPFKSEKEEVITLRKIANSEPFRLDQPRIAPLDEVEYVKELLKFQNALNRLGYIKHENIETEWESEIDSLIQWLKEYNLTEINGLSSFLKLKENGLDLKSINIDDFKDSIISFIKQEGTIFNLKAIMMRYRKLRLDWILQASHTTYDSSLPLRDKEILILRAAWLCRAQYEWDHHVIVGRRAGLTDNEINNIKEGLLSKKWKPFDKVLIQSVDELYRDNAISDSTWEALAEQYDMFQLMDLIFTVTSYNLLALFLNTFGIQTEECVKNLI